MSEKLNANLQLLKRVDIDLCLENARGNWKDWQFCYQKNGNFSSLPIFHDQIRFLGFGFDYSVFRGIGHDKLRGLRTHLSKCDDPASMSQLLESIIKGLNNTNKRRRVSLASKLLALWKPSEYPMWDNYARKGLRILHGKTRNHNYYGNSAETYATFKYDFHELKAQVSELISMHLTPEEREAVGFIERFFDSILMKLGGRKGNEY